MAIQKKQTTTSKRWPRYCLIAALAMVVIAAALYFWVYFTIDSEFSAVSDYYGDYYEELFSLSTPDEDMKDALLRQGAAAFACVGGEADIASFGELARYCTATEQFPTASQVEYDLEQLAGKTDGDEGYLWVAYTCRVYDANGQLLAAWGEEDQRILSRWSAEKIDGSWVVTKILEQPQE